MLKDVGFALDLGEEIDDGAVKAMIAGFALAVVMMTTGNEVALWGGD